MPRLTVFTPTYNRAKTIDRVFKSLMSQTYKDFIWLIIDDGSNDNTHEVVKEFISSADFPIKYIYQKNKGKHIAVNNAVKITDTELFIIADSDDSFVPEALEKLIDAWDRIPYHEKENYKGVNCRVFDHGTKKPIGHAFPYDEFDSNDEEAYFVLKMRSEKWNLIKTDILREFPFPEIKNAHFYPETIIWQLMARKYKTRYINDCLREYYRDTENAVTNKKSIRFRENIFLWTHFINNEFKYFFYFPKRFIQSFVGLSRDGILNGFSFFKILKIPNSFSKKMLVCLFYPCGFILATMYKTDNKQACKKI